MIYYDLDGNEIHGEPDLNNGWLREDSKILHHDAVAPVEEVWHYETVAEYPNGGREVRRVVDVPGVEARDAYDETVKIYVYIPYTEEELAEMERMSRQAMLERIATLEEQNEFLSECLMEMSELVYQ